MSSASDDDHPWMGSDMCGVNGVWDRNRRHRADELAGAVDVMNGLLRHRGPDGSGTWSDPSAHLVLGHTRLAIVDLTDNAQQPMISRDGRWVVSFNGEVYNHLDIRRSIPGCTDEPSDTRVLTESIADRGLLRTLDEIDAMFALAAWDRHTRTLHLARDRFGEKPLYHGCRNGTVAFASEIGPVAGVIAAGQIDSDALAHYLAFGYVSAPRSIYQNLFAVPPGSVVTYGDRVDQDPTTHRYWSAHEKSDEPAPGDAELLELLSNSVERRLHADVDLAVFLSGGLDSSLVASLAATHRSDISTFTVRGSGGSHDESDAARRLANSLGTRHSEVEVSASDALELVPRLADIWGEPFGDSSQLPTLLLSRAVRSHATVAITGDGGDELFAGYNRHVALPAIGSLRRRLGRSAPSVARAIRSIDADRLSGSKLLHRFVQLPATSLVKMADTLEAADLAEVYARLTAVGPIAGAIDRELLDLHDVLLADAETYLPGDILTKVDRAAMHHSLETRTPFLEPRLWSRVRSMAPSDLVGGVPPRGKQPVRRLLHQLVPDVRFGLVKKGFHVPIDQWLRGPLFDWASDLLADVDDEGTFADLVTSEAIRRHFDEHIAGTHDHQQDLWIVLMWLAWRRARPTARAVLEP